MPHPSPLCLLMKLRPRIVLFHLILRDLLCLPARGVSSLPTHCLSCKIPSFKFQHAKTSVLCTWRKNNEVWGLIKVLRSYFWNSTPTVQKHVYNLYQLQDSELLPFLSWANIAEPLQVVGDLQLKVFRGTQEQTWNLSYRELRNITQKEERKFGGKLGACFYVFKSIEILSQMISSGLRMFSPTTKCYLGCDGNFNAHTLSCWI